MSSFLIFGTKALLLLIGVVFNFLEFSVLSRFLLQCVKADFRNPFCQFLMQLTSPILHPLRRVIPGFYGFDVAALVLFYLLIVIEMSLSSLLTYHYWSALIFLQSLVIGIHFYLNFTFLLILFNALLSWVPNAKFQPVGILIHLLTEPYLNAVRRFIPPLKGLDFSSLIVLVVIQIINLGLASFLP
jgi:YggT family protein